MRIALIADTFPPLRTSGAIQLRDLAREFAAQKHELTVMLPASELTRQEPWRIERYEGVQVARLRAPETKDIGYARRTLNELGMPYAMLRSLRASPLANQKWDGIIWYSPSIFHAPLVKALKSESGCKSYLIIRDIFPEWAADMQLIGRGPTFQFFKSVARYQYSVADVIGVQTDGNLAYFNQWKQKSTRVLEVLPNWLGQPGTRPSSIKIADTSLAGRTVFVYAGNMGVAQNMDIILDAAARLQHRDDLGFLLVGRGSERDRLRCAAESRELNNIAFFDEIDPEEIPDLYRQCYAGIVSLDPRHKSHNIPGKFLTYMQCGLPVLASINRGNDLAALIRDNAVGQVIEGGEASDLADGIEDLLNQDFGSSKVRERSMELFAEKYSSSAAVQNIVEQLAP
ncbi:glycosyltransferase family 4 protein [Qipengyuania flava]|nr:glycosyltransferase family 4 protein [Qipengyuania flava]